MKKLLKQSKLIGAYMYDLRIPLRIAWPYIKKYKFQHIAIIIMMFVDIFSTLSYAWFLGKITDAAIGGDFKYVIKLIPIGIGLTLLTIITNYANTMIQATLSNGVVRDFKLYVFNHMLRLPTKSTAAKHSGELLAHVTNDVSGIMGLVGSSLLNFLRYPVTFLAAFIYVWQLNWKLAILVACAGPVVLGVSAVFSLILKRNSKKSLEIYSKASKVLNETFTGLGIIRAFTLEKQFYDKYKKQADASYNLSLENTKLQAYYSIASSTIFSAVSLLIMGLGAYFVAIGVTTMGSLMVFTKLMNYLVSPLTGMAGAWAGLQGSLASMERLQKLLNIPADSAYLPDVSKEKLDVRSIQLKNVTFSYTDKENVFEQLNVTIPAEKVVALVGPSGAGKSTLFNLLLGFYQPQQGDIELNGVSTKQMELSLLRNSIAYVPQESFLFADTIHENLMMVKPDATEMNMVQAAKDANIHDFIMSLPDGYETELGERGIRLSGGQKQRLSIARAILKDAPILLLDEATSALDSETEHLVQEALDRLMKGRTTLIIAHRLSTIQNANEILVMEHGEIVEAGTHEQLLRAKGHYYKMHQTQFKHAMVETA